MLHFLEQPQHNRLLNGLFDDVVGYFERKLIWSRFCQVVVEAQE